MRVVIALAVVLAPACSLLVSLDDLAGDAAADASSDASDGGGGFCATHAPVVFCDDFDEATQPFAKWSTVDVSGGGNASLIASSDSPPNAARFHDANDGGVVSIADILEARATVPKSMVDYSFDVRVEQYPSNGSLFSLSPIAPDSKQTPQIYFALNSTSATFAQRIAFPDGGVFFSQWTLTQRPSLNVWMNFHVHVTLGSPCTVSVYLGGAPAMTLNAPLDPRITFGTPVFTAGITYIDPAADTAIVDVDNVTIDYE